jgi:6-phosphogluconolactonase
MNPAGPQAVTPRSRTADSKYRLQLHVGEDAAAVAEQAAQWIARQVRQTVQRDSRCVLALSGGTTPQAMFAALADADVPWNAVHVVQVDERLAPLGDESRNLTHLQHDLLDRIPLPRKQVYRMPAEADDPVAAARRYTKTLEALAGSPPVFDIVHLGLGDDGHTASLVPGDPVLEVRDEEVAVTAFYKGRRRMTLTYPALDRARHRLWLVSGAGKSAMLARLLQGDITIPAGRVESQRSVVFADRAAAARSPA